VERGGVATGGTLFANALSLAAARATLADVLMDDAYERAAALGARLADGIEAAAATHGPHVARASPVQPIRLHARALISRRTRPRRARR
jgi:glutamate-1-semialdehyde aminotransferase